MEHLIYKGGCGILNIHISRHFKEELASAIDKRLRLITNTMLLKTVMPPRM